MSIRLMWCGVLVVGVALGGLSCTPTADAGQEAGLQEEAVRGDFCGGIAGIPCGEGFVCIDDPRDSCDPEQGGADCGGICRREHPTACTGREPGQKYVSRDPTECTLIDFICKEGYTPFFNECGCGCQRQKKSCDYNDPKRSYIARDPEVCATIRFLCAEGFQPFFNECGCGCEAAR